jgi:hypothetical protein
MMEKMIFQNFGTSPSAGVRVITSAGAGRLAISDSSFVEQRLCLGRRRHRDQPSGTQRSRPR